jgi:hypothetical protein
MAESVRYRGGRVNLSVPEQTAFEAQAAQRGSQLVAQSIDRMVSFFRQQSIEKAKVEAVEYGSANAPTAEQIEQARESGEELKLPGDNNTLFGRLARQAAASTVSDTIELAARQEINSALLDAQARRLNPADLQDKLDAIILGYSSSFDETVPSMSRALNAKLSVTANSKYTDYHSSYIAQARADGKAAFMTNQVANLSNPNLLAQFVDNEDPSVAVQSYVNNLLIQATARDFSSSEIKALSNYAQTQLVESASKTLQNNVLSNPYARNIIQELAIGKTGFITDPQSKVALAILRQSGLADAEIAGVLRQQRTAQINMENTEQEYQNRSASELEQQAEANVAIAMRNQNEAGVELALQELAFTNPVRAEELREKWVTTPGPIFSDKDTISALDNLRSNLKIENVLNAWPDLNQQDKQTYLERAEKLDNDDLQLALSIVKSELNLPANINNLSLNDPNFKTSKLYQKMDTALQKIFTDAKKNEVDFEPYIAAEIVLKEQSDAIKEASFELIKASIDRLTNSVFVTAQQFSNLKPLIKNSTDYQGAIAVFNEVENMKNKPSVFRNDKSRAASFQKLQTFINTQGGS